MIAAGFAVAGTDTGVGKTWVAAALVAGLRSLGLNALPCKPVQTGAKRGRSADLDFALHANQLKVTPAQYAQLAPVRLPLAASPHLAAQKAGRTLRVKPLALAVRRLQSAGIVPVIEGAGGLLVPLNAKETMLDLLQALGLPVVLAARPGLGTLNHTLLSAHALDSAGLSLAAVVLVHTQPGGGLIEKDNRATLQARLSCPVIDFPRGASVTEMGDRLMSTRGEKFQRL